MADWDDVRRIALDLPGVEEPAPQQWRVGGKLFAWERPLRRADLEALGDAAPAGAVLGLRVADEGVKQALLEERPEWCFTTPHFDGWPAVLVQLEHAPLDELIELVEESWLARAPKRLATSWLAER